MKDNNCIFCKLANGEIPTATLYEDEDFRVILDANPASPANRHPPKVEPADALRWQGCRKYKYYR